MGIKSFFSNLFYPESTEQRSGGVSPSVTYGLTDPKISELFSLNSGPVTVSEETALTLATVFRCVDVLSSSFASLPWELYRNEGPVSNPAIGHPVRSLLIRPHKNQTSYVWRKTLLATALLWGNGYARIIRNGVYRPTGLKLYHPSEVLVTTDRYKDTVEYRFPDVPGTVSADDVIHLKLFSTDGIIGRSVIRQAADSIKVPLQSRRFATKLMENGARPAGIITHPRQLKDTQKKNIASGWFSTHGGENNVGKTAILDEGMEFKAVGINPVDAQLLELMKMSREEVCALFGVPQHMAGILDRSTNNNIEHQGLEFVAYSLKPHVINFQQEFDYKTLRFQELGVITNELDLDDLHLTDIATRQRLFQFARTNGIMSANEVRDRMGMNPYEGGDTYYIQGAMVPIDTKTGFPIQPTKPTADTKNGTPVNGHKLSEN
ncbi:phage portal protein [Spirosoma sp. BT702]|uniref:Phage portal protein n=1 Tax=Spirosoma profusum TaxID=2771354 RepID=A0A927GAJ1_9BACT|nr:phage portal protein [Spirosoma profusum]MBD2705606.1 phage portal protein [Spirosoma profusum]